MSKNRIHVFSDDALGEHDAVAIADLVRRGELGVAEVAAAARSRTELAGRGGAGGHRARRDRRNRVQIARPQGAAVALTTLTG